MLTSARLHELFEYKDGMIFWKNDMTANKVAGRAAGSINSKGYLITGIDGKTYLNHRIIFLMHHGYLPSLIDHIDRNRTNNNIDNLRGASRRTNALNGKDRVNKSGHKYVYWGAKENRWYVMKKDENHTQKYYGYYEQKEDAINKAKELL